MDSRIRTDDRPGLQPGAFDRSAMSTDRQLAEGTGTDPEACRLQALSRRCPSPMGLPSLFGGERRSRSPTVFTIAPLSRWARIPSGSLSRTLAEGGVLETQSLARPICVQSSLGPCPIHPLLCGAPGRFRSGCLLPDKQALSRLSYGGMKGGSGRSNRTTVGDGI